MVLIAFLVFGVILLVLGVSTYNALVSLRAQVDRSWANIDVVLKQRFDEIPQLVEVLEQFVHHERAVIEKLVKARTRYGNARGPAQKIDASREMSVALGGVVAIGEGYPELKSNTNFLQLQGRVSDLEGALADRREHYNDSVTNFNARIAQIPDVFFARMLGYQPVGLFEISAAERARPSLKIPNLQAKG